LDEEVEKRLAGLADGGEGEVNAVFDEDQTLRDKYFPYSIGRVVLYIYIYFGCIVYIYILCRIEYIYIIQYVLLNTYIL